MKLKTHRDPLSDKLNEPPHPSWLRHCCPNEAKSGKSVFPSSTRRGGAKRRGGAIQKIDFVERTTPALRATPPWPRRGKNFILRPTVSCQNHTSLRGTSLESKTNRWRRSFLHIFFEHGFVFIVLGLVLFFFCGSGIAQQRPLLTEDPDVIPAGTLTSEIGIEYLDHARFPFSGLGGNELSIVSGLHFGLGDRAEFQITGPLHRFLWVRENSSGKRNDWGDGALSTKIKIVGEKGARPIVSFRPTVVLPNSNDRKGIGTNTTQFFGSLLFGKHLQSVYVFGDAGLGILDDTLSARAQQDVLTYGVASVWTAGTRLKVLGEVNGRYNARAKPHPGGESLSQARLGFQVRAGGARWDVAGTAGLTRTDHKAGVVFGMTRDFRLWK